jgi:hypothetical protein
MKQDTQHELMRLEVNTYYGANTGGIYETTKAEVEPDSVLQGSSMSGKPWASWGTDNNYPQRLIDAVMADPSATLLEKRIAMHWGLGFIFYKRRVEKDREIIEPIGKEFPNAEIEDFFFENDMDNTQQGFISDFEWWHAFPANYILNPFGKVLKISHKRMKDVRSELRNKQTGRIDNYYLSGNWPNPEQGSYAKLPAFDRMGNHSGLYKHQLVSIDKDYNPQPAWHGITRWLHIASKIPRWILANIDNSINLKYHVKIPLEYFMKRHPVEMYPTAEERNKAIQKEQEDTFKKMDDFLAGEKNVHKAFYSLVAVDDQGKPLPGWEIITIPNEIKDEAWLNAYGVAAMAITSGNGLSPSIGGQVLPNGLGSGSGSDLREQFNFYMQVMTALPRNKTLEWYKLVRKRNKWPADIHLGYRDVILQSTDQNKSGFAKPTEAAPTSDKQDATKTQP